MARLTIFRIDGDPLSSDSIRVLAAFPVDAIAEYGGASDAQDSCLTRLDVSEVPDLKGRSETFQTFESYSGYVGDTPITFALLQYSDPRYILLQSGTLSAGDTIRHSRNSIAGVADAKSKAPVVSAGFTARTPLATPTGYRAVETLKAGDPVVLADGRVDRVRWIAPRRLGIAHLRASPDIAPVRIAAHTFGAGRPGTDLLISPQHRIAVSAPLDGHKRTRHAVLAPVRSLINGHSIKQVKPQSPVDYYQLLFERHQLVDMQGLLAESFFPTPAALEQLHESARNDLFLLFPALRTDADAYGDTVLPVMMPGAAGLVRTRLAVPTLPEMRRSA